MEDCQVVHCGSECRPLDSLDELLAWADGSDHPLNDCKPYEVVRLKIRTPTDQNRPKTLHCHDMKGGYQEDR